MRAATTGYRCWARAPAVCPPPTHDRVPGIVKGVKQPCSPKGWRAAPHRLPAVQRRAASPRSRRATTRAVLPVAAVAGLAAFSMAAPAATMAAPRGGPRGLRPPGSRCGPSGPPPRAAPGAESPAAQCLADFGIHGHSPVQYRVAYDLNSLYSGAATGRPITGAGKTIVIVDSYGSPTIQSDIQTFDQQWGSPQPRPADRAVRRHSAVRPDQLGPWSAGSTKRPSTWSTRIDAPGVKIVLAETPVAETEGVTGFPEMMNAEQSLINSGRRRRDLAELRRDLEHLPRLQFG